MKIEELFKNNPDLERVDARDMGTHPRCGVWLDGQSQNDVVEMVAHVEPGTEVDGAVRRHRRDADENLIVKDGELLMTEWKFGKIRWEPT